jgi:hypothetical protein
MGRLSLLLAGAARRRGEHARGGRGSEIADVYPNIAKLVPVAIGTHEGPWRRGCDDQFEFEFALDLILEGLERLREREAP